MGKKSKLIAAMLMPILGVVAAEILVFEHPFGYVVSIIVAVLLVWTMIVVARRTVKKWFRDSAEFQKATDELTDRILTATDDPDEPARFVP